ncbi:MAG: hypothetical protein UZ05_CHB002002212 [Chlorobi bacterium OLB5]|nr:MAG: hypothetical protein UZ05_CHB002002212 [Chlorobi bacterium OLB5]
MKQGITKILFGGLMLTYLLITGCGNNGPTEPLNNYNVTFQISQRINPSGSVQFIFKPSADAKISSVVSRYRAEQFTDSLVYGNPDYIYSKDSAYIINNYTGVTQGQQWQFEFTGKAPAANNTYKVTTDYTVQ